MQLEVHGNNGHHRGYSHPYILLQTCCPWQDVSLRNYDQWVGPWRIHWNKLVVEQGSIARVGHPSCCNLSGKQACHQMAVLRCFHDNNQPHSHPYERSQKLQSQTDYFGKYLDCCGFPVLFVENQDYFQVFLYSSWRYQISSPTCCYSAKMFLEELSREFRYAFRMEVCVIASIMQSSALLTTWFK